MTQFTLRFDSDMIGYWAGRYRTNQSEALIEQIIAHRVRAAGYITRPDFLELCEWKSPRIRKPCAKNSESFIAAVTQTAFATTHQRLRVEVLTLLKGVSWPVASVLLHFGSNDPYPILDFRALWSLGVQEPPIYYSFDYWCAYFQYCRQLASECGVTMRILDRALWQYSKEHQLASGVSKAAVEEG